MLHNIEPNQNGPRGEAMANAVGKCVHCGFCLPACPTYQELESEMDSPRGRILLMKAVLEGEMKPEEVQPHVDRCLGCLACVSHCPSGVPYGDLISSYRALRQPDRKQSLVEKVRTAMVENTLPYARRFRWAAGMGRMARPFKRWFPKAIQPMLELLPEQLPKPQPIPELTPAVGKRRGRVALLAGCAQQVLAPDINAATVRVLARNGIEVIVPAGQGCCGALSWHQGREHAAAGFAKKLMATIPTDVDCLLTTAAGCGSAIEEYPLLLANSDAAEEARSFASNAMDVTQYLDSLDLVSIPRLSQPTRVAYQDACHLAHAQGVRQPPRRLLGLIPDLEVVAIADADTCCGSAGTYNVEQPEIAANLGKRKAESILRTNASICVTGNIGCLVQIEKHLNELGASIPVVHTMQVLDRAYREIPI